MQKQNLVILGSTGSIGHSTLSVIEHNPDKYHAFALVGGKNVETMFEQCVKFQPHFAALDDENAAKVLREKLALHHIKTEVLDGQKAICDLAAHPDADQVMAAIVGAAGLLPTLSAVKASKKVLLANKESLVTCGQIFIDAVKQSKAKLLPVDSEHNAIFQSLPPEAQEKVGFCPLKELGVSKIVLTGSGGPFRYTLLNEFEHITPEQAVAHPNWSMGRKITVDSATLVNKGLEVIEAKWLFGVDFDDIHVVVQPKSVIHSMIQFKDGSVIAQLGTPDMKLPIQYALFYPQHRNLAGERLDFAKLKEITFEEPPVDVLKGLPYAYKAGRIGGSMPTVLNAANVKAVALFLDRKIQFLDIYDIIEDTMNAHKVIENPTLEEVLETEQWVYEHIESR